ncbi:MAG: CRISPR-associated CARF protein Csa3 [Desulfurococcaceae archaeon]|nr:CRISPR-associated CARF protein Csa3 [Desulfurococcaceae archaeon]
MNLITTLGFDISHTLLVLTKAGVKPSRIVAIVGMVRNEIDSRAETAYTMLKQFANMIGVSIERVDVEVTDVEKAIEKILSVLDENAPAVLDIGGGLRLLVLETFIAYQLLNPQKRSSITLYIALEGRNEVLNIDFERIRRRLLVSKRLSETHREVLKIIEEKGEATPKEILEELNKRGITMTKQKLSKILSKLTSLGLVEREERGKYRHKT